MRTRKTRDEYHIQGNNGYGWETECSEDSWSAAKAMLRCYRENVSYPMRVVKRRVRISNATTE